MKTYTIPEFMQMTREKEKKLDKVIGHLRRNEKAYRQLVLIIALMGICTTQAHGVDFTKIDNFGFKALRIVRAIGYWAILIKGMSDIVGHASQGDAKGAFRCAFQYAVIFAVLFLFPMMLDLVKEAFA